MVTFKVALLLLAVLASLSCTVLLFRGYARTATRLLFWSALCFVFLTLNNVLLFTDIVIFPVDLDLRIYRLLAALAAIVCLLYAFVWESE